MSVDMMEVQMSANRPYPTETAAPAVDVYQDATSPASRSAALDAAVAALLAQLGHGADGVHIPPDTTDLAALMTQAASALEMERRRSKEALGDRAALMAAWERVCSALGAKDEDSAMALMAAQADAVRDMAASRGEALARVTELKAQLADADVRCAHLRAEIDDMHERARERDTLGD